MAEGKFRVGTHNDEIPRLFPITKEGKRKMVGSTEFRIDASSIKEFRLFEGIHLNCVHGYVTFTDPGIYRISTIMREGYDYIEMETESIYFGGTNKVRFEVYNIEGLEEGRLYQGYDIVTLRLVQFPAYRHLQVWNVSKGYKDKKISEVVKDILNEFINKNNSIPYEQTTDAGPSIEDTTTKMESFCIPFWNPHTTLNYLKEYAQKGDKAGFFWFFDLNNKFHFRSLEHLLSNGLTHNFEMKDIRNVSLSEAANESQKVVRDYYMNFVQKQYYKSGLAGASAERFNWFTKKHYTLKNGYLKRPVQNINNIFEKPEYINNMFGFHMFTGYRWQDDNPFTKAMVYNKLLTAVAAQGRTHVVINGKVDMKPGDKIIVENKVQGINNNVEELGGTWFVRAIDYVWNPTKVYSQILHLSRDGAFYHTGP